MALSPAKLTEIYTSMVRIRAFEEGVNAALRKYRVPAAPSYTRGTEAVAAGVCAVLEKEDYLLTNHRPNAPLVARGASLKRMVAQFFGKETGYSKGKGGRMHLSDLDLNIIGASVIVGAYVPVACGVGLGCRMQNAGRVCVCFFGDGAITTGAFHEGMGLAAIWDLPVILVCENNQYASILSMPVRQQTRLKKLSDAAKGYGVPGVTVDGNDAIAVAREAARAVKRAREGGGPTLIEAETYITGAGTNFPLGIRTAAEEEEWRRRDPIDRLQARLLAGNVMTQAELGVIQKTVEREVEEAVKFAVESPDPDPGNVLAGIFYEGKE